MKIAPMCPNLIGLTLDEAYAKVQVYSPPFGLLVYERDKSTGIATDPSAYSSTGANNDKKVEDQSPNGGDPIPDGGDVRVIIEVEGTHRGTPTTSRSLSDTSRDASCDAGPKV
ncbi:MAG TPA: PASTA domain-containing protein [Planctomycetota bacterium]